ncbi:MAG: hypothetical protein ACYSUF_01145, partial [Planctomycetota bacterium]
PPSAQEPPQLPFLHSQAQQPEGTFISDDQFMQDFLKENHTVPLTVLIVSGVLAFLFAGYQGYAASEPGMGLAGALGTCIIVALLLGVGCLASIAAGWIICKISGEDYGSPGALILRFSAVAVAQVPVFALINAVVGGFLLSYLIFLPVMFILTMVIAGLDVIRTFLFCVVLGVINMLLTMFVLASFATAVTG